VRAPDKRQIQTEQVSELTTARLSIYLRCLDELDRAGVRATSSGNLAERLGLNPAQIRKDLATFGEFGVRGVGYRVQDLRRHLRAILGLDRRLRMVILGAGNLGSALADYPGFRADGFEVVALLDVDEEKVGRQSRTGVSVRHLRELAPLAAREHLDIAVVAVPGPVAQAAVDQVVAAGIRAILNFSPGALRVPRGVKLKSVDLTVSLESLSYFLASEVHDRKDP
jgi:redox-sensing transcriptional repressor